MQNIPSPGELVGGKYRVLGLLGQGGMGAVLEAEHDVTHKRVAIKWMHPEIAGSVDAQARFVREAQASARVRHPNIVDVYDVVRAGDALFLVMELLEGETLTALLRRGGTPIYKLIELLLPALRAVAAAHRQGVIHRDLKPDNIFLSREPDSKEPIPKVLDFGISKVAGASGLTLTRTGAAMGTPMYMSLEQLCGDKDLDARSDVYALGVILYEAVTGRPPFEAETFSELAIKVATLEPPGPKQVRPELPSALAKLIGSAMAKRRENRTASVEQLVRELEPFASEQSFRAKMTNAQGALPRVRGESEPPLKVETPSAPPPAVAPPAQAQAVEASPTYSRAGASTPAPAGGSSRLRAAAIALGATCALSLGAWLVSRQSSEPLVAPDPAPAPLALPAAPAAHAPSETIAIEPSVLSGSADAAIAQTPSAAPLAPKTHRTTSSGAGSESFKGEPRSTRPPRPSAVKRAGPARIDDF